MNELPRFVSFVAVLLGCFDLVRGLVHTVFAGSTGVELSGVDLSGPTGRDQLMFLVAFGYSNFITGAALIYLGLRNRFGALMVMTTIPVALLIAGVSLNHWGADLVGQGVFPGVTNMRIYAIVCILTVVTALGIRWRDGLRLRADRH